uniref:Uncharacterized protein n=1 Tax=Aegilops tauschii subsp. strangulata TaxID=200361 RepID=A0A453BXQ4_AEGTS
MRALHGCGIGPASSFPVLGNVIYSSFHGNVPALVHDATFNSGFDC